MAECLNCGASFERRQDGGKRQKFCSEPCRREFAKDALAHAEWTVAAGLLTRDRLREGPRSNAALVSSGVGPVRAIPASPSPGSASVSPLAGAVAAAEPAGGVSPPSKPGAPGGPP